MEWSKDLSEDFQRFSLKASFGCVLCWLFKQHSAVEAKWFRQRGLSTLKRIDNSRSFGSPGCTSWRIGSYWLPHSFKASFKLQKQLLSTVLVRTVLRLSC